MAEYKLTYLNYRGRAELIRFILSQAGVEFEDCRLAPEQWPEFRPKTQFGVLPTLEFDGKRLSGNGPIARYLAEKYGLAGSGDFENAEVFALVDVVEDMWMKMIHIFIEKDEKRKGEMKETFKTSHLPLTLTKLEKSVAENNCEEGWIYGSKVTYADFAVYVLLETLETDSPSLLDNFPSLNKLKSSVQKLPNIDKWLKNRPLSPY